MTRLHLLILWVLAIAAGIFYFKSKDIDQSIDSQTKLETGSNLVPGDTVENIDGFIITDGEESVTLKKVDDEWSVSELGDFPANLTTVSRVIQSIREAKVAQGVVASQEYYDRFDLDPAAKDSDKKPQTITFLSEGKEGATLYLGKNRTSTGGSGSTAGRFVRLSDDESGIYIVSETFGFLGANPDNWIEKVLTPLEEKPIKIEVNAPNDDTFKSWTVSRKTVLDDLLIEGLAETEETRTAETALLKSAFTRSNFSELVSKEEYDKRADTKGIRTVKATDSAGTTFLITITPQKKEEKEEEETPNPAQPIPSIDYLVSIELLNGPTKPEIPAEDADIQAKAVFQERLANLEDLSRAVNRMASTYKDRYFLVNTSAISSLLKNRGELIQPKKVKKDPVSVTTNPIRVPTPGDDAPNQPGIEATTPPIRVPPLLERPEGTKPDEAVKPPETPAPSE